MQDDAPTDVVIGRLLGDARAASGLSQAAAGRRLGVPQSRVAKLELGHRHLLFIEALQLAELYGVPVTSFDPRSEPQVGLTTRRRRVDARDGSANPATKD